MSLKHLILFFICGTASFTACCLVDEDLSDCEAQKNFNYEIFLETNAALEFEAVLGQASDKAARETLKPYMDNVFRDNGRDLELAFHDALGAERLGRFSFIMDASQAEYTLHLREIPYRHLAVANVAQNGVVSLLKPELSSTAVLQTAQADTLDTHKSALFTARPLLDAKSGQSFNVRMYMANCAAALVLDTVGSHIRELEIFAAGFADSFNVCDSTYDFSVSKIIRPDKLEIAETHQLCFAAVTFPSKDTRPTKTTVQTEAPFVSTESAQTLWQFRSYATLPDGTVTKSTLDFRKPLRAGQLKLIKAKIDNKGALVTHDSSVGVSVTLDWNKGMDVEVEL